MRLPLGFILSVAFVLGVALDASDLFLPVLVFAAGTIALLWLWTPERRTMITGAVFLLLMIAGMLRTTGAESYPHSPNELVSARSFVATVIDVPQHYPMSSHGRLEIHQPVESRVWGQLPPFPTVQQGDVLEVSGSFIPNERTEFRGFSAQRDTTGVIYADTVRVTANNASSAQQWRNRMTSEISSRLRSRIPEPAGAFATGVILGDDGAMTEATRDAFRVGGLTHMTAVSGVHVGIIAAAILLVSRLGLVNRWWMLGFSIPVIWSFAYLVGMRPSVVRASLMLTLLLIANLLGRPRDTLNAVGLAAVAMLIIDPSFRNDIGFQLSVAATTGIALGILLVGRHSHWHLVWVVPVSAQLATEPLILYHFGYYSLVSPLANIIAMPFLAITMGMSLLTVIGSVISATLADALAIATWAPAFSVVLIADFAAQVPYLSADVRPLTLTGIWSAYAVLAGLVGILFVFLEGDSEDPDQEIALLYRV